MEKVSIVIPVYNGAEFLFETINSCMNQSYKNLEIIIIDDGSGDRSEEIILEICQIENRIIYIKNEVNLGLIKSLNKGIHSSTGKYVIALGQDDLLRPSHVEVMISNMNPDVVFVFCQSDLIDDKGKIFKPHEELTNTVFDLFRLSKGNCINSCGLMMNRADFIKVKGFTESALYPNYGEWELWIKLASIGKIVYENRVSSLYRRHTNNISNTFQQIDTKKKLNIYFDFCRKLAYKNGNFSSRQKIIFLLSLLKYKVFYYTDIIMYKITKNR